MIDKDILDQVIPQPEIAEARESLISDLQDEGFVITNFHAGGVFYTLAMVVLRIEYELRGLARNILNNMFLTHASGPWLDLKASDQTKKRKTARKTKGRITLTREEGWVEAVKIPEGYVFKTERDVVGDELRYFVVEATVLRKGDQRVDVLVEAEKEGSRYNVPQGQITRSLVVMQGIGGITNGAGWITQEGCDTEDDDSLRERTLSAWDELAKVPLRGTYENVCREIPGVLCVSVDDQHPRGQGTVDITITSEAGEATADLLEKCRSVVDGLKEPDSDVLVKSAEITTQDIAVTVTIANGENHERLSERTAAVIADVMQLRKRKPLCQLTHAEIIYQIKRDISAVQNVIVTTPASDIMLGSDMVIVAGEISVTVQEV